MSGSVLQFEPEPRLSIKALDPLVSQPTIE